MEEAKSPHCLVLPFPLQGHINPMFQFCKRLQRKGILKITLVTTRFFLKSVALHNPLAACFPVETFSDGFDDGGAEKASPQEAVDRWREAGSRTLTELLEKLRSSGSGVDCVIYDPMYPWVFQVAEEFGLTAAIFLTQSNSVNSIYFQVNRGEVKLPVVEDRVRICDGLPELERRDLPSFIRDHESNPKGSEIMADQFLNVERIDWIFVNSFHALEQEVTDWMTKFIPVRTVGPTLPSMFLDKRIPDDLEYGLSLFTPITDPCMEWLDEQPPSSVIYVSFGSFAKPSARQMEELAHALMLIDSPFLWVVRESEEPKLPESFKEETSTRGLIVTWCPQLRVLAHRAVGCFVTHCGWNSTLEALSLGVPMVAMPQWSDQSTNAKFVSDVWRVGIEAKMDDVNGVVGRAEVVDCIKYVMEGETAEEMRANSRKWKELAVEDVDEGGSSDLNIQEFVSHLMFKHASKSNFK